MFVVNEDLSIYATRGDVVFFNVSAKDHGYPYTFRPGDIIRMSIYGKKDSENVVLQKDFGVSEATKEVFIFLEENETRIGEPISKHKDYWYEVELNPDTHPQTIIGYNNDGPRIFRLFPEAAEIPKVEINPEDIPVVDAELSMTSHRPVENQAVAIAIAQLTAAIEELKGNVPAAATEGSVFNAEGQIERIAILTIDAFGVAVKNGFKGTVEEWLASLKPARGVDYWTEEDTASIKAYIDDVILQKIPDINLEDTVLHIK